MNKTAKEMFEELGYEEEFASDIEIIYIKNPNSDYDKYGLEFDNLEEEYIYYNVSDGMRYYGNVEDKSLLQAIHQQMKELGWLNE